MSEIGLERFQVFEHVNNKGERRLFSVWAITQYLERRHLDEIEVGTVPMSPSLFFHVMDKGGVEDAQLARTLRKMRDAGGWTGLPAIILILEDDTHLIIDGNHRVACCGYLGLSEFPAIMVSKAIWNQFCLNGVPDDWHDHGTTLLIWLLACMRRLGDDHEKLATVSAGVDPV